MDELLISKIVKGHLPRSSFFCPYASSLMFVLLANFSSSWRIRAAGAREGDSLAWKNGRFGKQETGIFPVPPYGWNGKHSSS